MLYMSAFVSISVSWIWTYVYLDEITLCRFGNFEILILNFFFVVLKIKRRIYQKGIAYNLPLENESLFIKKLSRTLQESGKNFNYLYAKYCNYLSIRLSSKIVICIVPKKIIKQIVIFWIIFKKIANISIN